MIRYSYACERCGHLTFAACPLPSHRVCFMPTTPGSRCGGAVCQLEPEYVASTKRNPVRERYVLAGAA